MIPATSSAHFSNAASLLDLTTFAPPPVACRRHPSDESTTGTPPVYQVHNPFCGTGAFLPISQSFGKHV
jgi:hypothetical protein